MKIAFLINELNICGGTHKQLLKLIEYTEKQGFDFCIITKVVDFDKIYKGFEKYASKTIVVKDRPFIYKVLNRLGAKKIVLKNDYKYYKQLTCDCDVINIHDYGFEDFQPAFEGKKVCWQVNDLPGCFRVGVHSNSKVSKKILKKQNILRNNAKYITDITVNVNKNADRIKKCFGRDAHTFYCGVEPICIERNINETFNRFDQKKINLLTSGVMLPYRNYETQIYVVKHLREKGYDVKLNIIGNLRNREYAEKIKNLIRSENLGEYIQICGQVDNSTFELLHKNADIFLFVNIDQSWGLAVFEAMSCGLPVLLSNSVGAIEILNNQIDSIFVNPTNVDEITNEIISLVENKSHYCSISSKAQEFHKLWTWDKAYSSKMIDLFISYFKE